MIVSRSRKRNIKLFIFNISFVIIGVFIIVLYIYNPQLKLRFNYDLKEIINFIKLKTIVNDKVSNLRIEIKNKHFNKIKDTAKTYAKKIILDEKINYPALIKIDKDIIPINIRLKGDWTSHVTSQKKLSFRIRILDSKYSYMGMRKFSIQHPRERNYLNEWLFTNILRENSILAPRINFVNVWLNNDNWGLYLLEESFSKELLESNNRRESVIVKLNEDYIWEQFKFAKGQSKIPPENTGAFVDMFDYKKYSKDPDFINLYSVGKKHLESIITGKGNFTNIFDRDKMATYWALCDLFNAHHGCMTLHNLRFYYNPITSLLEPIHYDGNTQIGVGKRLLIGDPKKNFLSSGKDHNFQRKYISELNRVTSVEFINNIIANYSKLIKDYEIILKSDSGDYASDKKTDLDRVIDWDKLLRHSYQLRKFFNPIDSTRDVKAFMENNESNLEDIIQLFLVNKKKLLIQVNNIEYYHNNKWNSFNLEDNMTLPWVINNDNNIFIKRPNSIKYNYDLKGRINLNILGHKRTEYINILRENIYNFNDVGAPNQNSEISKLLELHKFINLNSNDELIFDSGSYTVKNNILIPDGYKVFINKGTSLFFNQDSFFSSYSPVYFNGTLDNPIIFNALNQYWAGFILINAKEISKFNYFNIYNVNSINRPGWISIAGITFYNTNIYLNNCHFKNSYSEDLMGIMNSVFEINNITFENSFSDSLDIDFSKGLINKADFYNSNNDSLDISGSNVELNYLNIYNAGDKGVSIGEDSYVKISNSNIINSNIGLVSKDGSQVSMDNIKFHNNNIVAIASYNKKSEYESASILADNIIFDNNGNNYFLEENNSIILNHIRLQKNKSNLKELLYGEKTF